MGSMSFLIDPGYFLFTQVIAQFPRVRGMPQPRQRLCFDLAYTLTRDAQFLAHFFQRV